MILEQQLQQRSNCKCELCTSSNLLSIYAVPPQTQLNEHNCILICETCKKQIENKGNLNPEHWKCILNSMWSDIPAVQVVSWRILNKLKNETWATDALDILYMDEAQLAWAQTYTEPEQPTAEEVHKDCNGNTLNNGDTVVLTKSLDVKGSNVNARLGTVVKNIRLVAENTEQIEGKIEGQTIVILTKYLRKG